MFDLLEAKLLPPQGHGATVPRAELIDRIESSREIPLVSVCAAPGWGKTTLLAQWDAQSDRPFAWVNIDERDNDPIVLLTYIAVALDRIAPLDPRVFDALASPGVSVEGTVVLRLGAALSRSDQPFVLVMDDLHLLDNPACIDAIASLAWHVPKGSQLAISAREPILPLRALRAPGLALDIGPDDLRMDTPEAGQLLAAAGVDLPAAQVDQLTEHTEGWSAGIYLAALSIRTRKGESDDPATLSGSDRLVSDYLHSELLANLSADEVSFLTRTAALERMSGPLCDAVLETSGSAERLASLARSNRFLVPLDPGGTWYRYHHLFREMLRSELERVEPDVVPRLLVRAAEWCERGGQPENAMDYAQQAGAVDYAASLFERLAPTVYQSGRVATAERWLHWLERHGALERNALAAVLGAMLAALWGRPAEAERLADAADHADYAGPVPDGSPSIDSWRALLSALRCPRGVASMRADAELALDTLAPGSRARPNASLLLAISLLLAGEIDHADDLFAEVVIGGLEFGTVEEVTVALCERAVIAIERGSWTEAEGFIDRALSVIRRSRMDEYPSTALTYAVAARVAVRRGEAERAQGLLARAQRLRLRLTHALPWIAVQARLELAQAYIEVNDAAGGETMLREVEALLRRQPDLGTLPSQAEALRARLGSMRAQAPGVSTLTEAELRVLPYLATQLSFKEIGERLYLSRHTVKSHAVAIYRKLNVTSRTGAVQHAGELGLL